MNSYVALFRGINVGGHHLLPMKELTLILQKLGLNDVKTYIQSGNVIFKSSSLPAGNLPEKISAAIQDIKGFSPAVIILDIQTLERAVGQNPYAGEEEKSLHYFFLADVPESPDLEPLTRIAADDERFEWHGRLFYLCAPSGIGRSKLVAKIEKTLGVTVTARNGRTVNKLIALSKS